MVHYLLMQKRELPKRVHLPHEMPSWVGQGAKHFITINCSSRTTNRLIETADSIIESAVHYESLGRWYVWLFVLMPDHLHMIATFDLNRGIKTSITAWKSYHAKCSKIVWQADFFEHRLRDQAEFDEKAAYLRLNPVRKGLVERSEQWPHIVDRTDLQH